MDPVKEELDELAVDEDVRTEGEDGGQTESNEGTKTGERHGGTPTTDGSPTPTPMEEDTRQLVRGSTESELGRVLEALTPLDGARFRRGRWHVRLYLIAQVGPVRVGTPWDKSPSPPPLSSSFIPFHSIGPANRNHQSAPLFQDPLSVPAPADHPLGFSALVQVLGHPPRLLGPPGLLLRLPMSASPPSSISIIFPFP